MCVFLRDSSRGVGVAGDLPLGPCVCRFPPHARKPDVQVTVACGLQKCDTSAPCDVATQDYELDENPSASATERRLGKCSAKRERRAPSPPGGGSTCATAAPREAMTRTTAWAGLWRGQCCCTFLPKPLRFEAARPAATTPKNGGQENPRPATTRKTGQA